MTSQIDTNTIYTQASETFRHYALKTLNVRIVYISQCLIISFVVFELLDKDRFYEGIFLVLFGCAFTFILRSLDIAFLMHAKNMAEFLRQLERKESEISFGGMSYIREKRQEKISTNPTYDWVISKSIYWLVFLCYLFILIYIILLILGVVN